MPSGLSTPLSFLLESYRPIIYTWAKHLITNTEDAEDICQEVCLNALKGEKAFRGQAEYSTWLYQITVNVFRDKLRKRQRRREIYLEDLQIYFDSDEKPTAVVYRVQSTLQLLNARQRQLLIMKYVDGYSHSEISRSLGIKETSACRALHRAKLAFKQAYTTTNRDEV